MCGRFALISSGEAIIEHFRLTQSFAMIPRYNICPGEVIPTIGSSGALRASGLSGSLTEINFLKWGFLPKWIERKENNENGNHNGIHNGFINARAETIQTKPAFKDAFQKRRCLIIADGYYEWKPNGRTKQPFYIHRKDKRLFAMAGIYEKENETCAILTTEANSLLSPLHPRMPVILSEEDYQVWLNPKSSLALITQILSRISLSDPFAFHPVSTKVNNPKTEGSQCILSLQ